MLDKETVEKAEYIFDKTIQHERAEKLFNQYINILDITYEQGKYIITHNVWASNWFWLVTTNWGIVCSNKTYIEQLIIGTLCRKEEDIYNPIEEKDKEILKEYYNLKL